MTSSATPGATNYPLSSSPNFHSSIEAAAREPPAPATSSRSSTKGQPPFQKQHRNLPQARHQHAHHRKRPPFYSSTIAAATKDIFSSILSNSGSPSFQQHPAALIVNQKHSPPIIESTG
ncbi:hypothetical protein NC652_028617 [Populus alba x Populus x berolinensis]|uniref:Uncharacterized protein n=2 Tax=Populus TaxID=3689 RepID=A0A4U5R377_POPAL|nr:hypothetical protein NC652_028617 [Populus alba x Populus x berolinensis]KAJ6978420.1 hypothetical protein NC653_026733 [Populus alba x Populus x berolinensis]TKS18242.1 hypothetical protein D5086_0000004910 [Populus alba]